MGCDLELSVEGYQEILENKKDSGSQEEMMAVINIPSNGAPVSVHKKFLMDVTKKVSRHVTKSASALEKFILRMDALIDGMETVKAIPVELAGIRSYKLNPRIARSKNNLNLSLVVSVKARAHGQIYQGNE